MRRRSASNSWGVGRVLRSGRGGAWGILGCWVGGIGLGMGSFDAGRVLSEYWADGFLEDLGARAGEVGHRSRPKQVFRWYYFGATLPVAPAHRIRCHPPNPNRSHLIPLQANAANLQQRDGVMQRRVTAQHLHRHLFTRYCESANQREPSMVPNNLHRTHSHISATESA